MRTISSLSAYLICGLLMCSMAFAAAAPAVDPIADKDYSAYLQKMPQVVSPMATYIQLLPVAIALERTNGWDGTTGKQAEAWLGTSAEAKRQFAAVKLLVKDDLTGLEMIFNGGVKPGVPPGEIADAEVAEKLLRDHGFTVAADGFAVVIATRGNSFGSGPRDGDGLLCAKAWLRIPKSQYPPLDRVMAMRSRMKPRVVGCSYYLYQLAKDWDEKKNDGYTREQYLDLAFHINKALSEYKGGNGYSYNNFSYDTSKICNDYLAKLMADDQPENGWENAMSMTYIASGYAYAPRLKDLTEDALARVPAPGLRDVRVAALNIQARYQQYLKSAPTFDGYIKLVADYQLKTDDDPLFAADAALFAGDFAGASKTYTAKLADDKATLGVRIYAWSGLLDSDPGTALPATTKIIDEVEKVEPAKRAPLLRWIAWRMWQAETREFKELPPKGYDMALLGSAKYNKLSAVKDAPAQCSAIMDRLLNIDPLEMLRPDPKRDYRNLCYAFAITHLWAGEAERAMKVSMLEVKETLPPPFGGWRNDMGMLDIKMYPKTSATAIPATATLERNGNYRYQTTMTDPKEVIYDGNRDIFGNTEFDKYFPNVPISDDNLLAYYQALAKENGRRLHDKNLLSLDNNGTAINYITDTYRLVKALQKSFVIVEKKKKFDFKDYPAFDAAITAAITGDMGLDYPSMQVYFVDGMMPILKTGNESVRTSIFGYIDTGLHRLRDNSKDKYVQYFDELMVKTLKKFRETKMPELMAYADKLEAEYPVKK